jgi:hypothetical protein
VENHHTSKVQYFSEEPAYVNVTVLSGETASVNVTTKYCNIDECWFRRSTATLTYAGSALRTVTLTYAGSPISTVTLTDDGSPLSTVTLTYAGSSMLQYFV